MVKLSNLAHCDIATVIHPYTNLDVHTSTGPLVLEEARGIYVFDNEGNEYIEGLAGLWCTSLGYGNQELVDAATNQMSKLSFSHLFGHKSHDAAIELSEKLKEIAPCETSKILFCGSGSEANDMQIKLTWYYNNARGKPQKKKVISRIKGYHGVTVASGSLTGLPPVHADFDLPIQNILHTSCPHYYRFGEEGESEHQFSERMVQDLVDLIEREGPQTIAAFIAEPIMGAGGVLVPPKAYFPKIRAVCDKYDIRFIADEVITGFGRTGEWFGSQTLDVKPDSISMAKAITSAYFPLGAITIEEDLYQAMLEQSEKIGTFGHGYTYTGHPVGAAVALKVLEIYQRDNIVGRAAKMGEVFMARLNALADHPLVGQARGTGMLGACELVSNKQTKQPFDPKDMIGLKAAGFAQDNKLICRAVGDALALCPPLIMTESELNEMFDRYEKGLNATLDYVTKENLLT